MKQRNPNSPPGSLSCGVDALSRLSTYDNAHFEQVDAALACTGYTADPSRESGDIGWLLYRGDTPMLHLNVKMPSNSGTGMVSAHAIAPCTQAPKLCPARELPVRHVRFAQRDRGVRVVVAYASTRLAGERRLKSLKQLLLKPYHHEQI
jgi:hypothetical protein